MGRHAERDRAEAQHRATAAFTKAADEAKAKAEEKPVDFAGINLAQQQTLIMQYLMGALDNWRDGGRGSLWPDDRARLDEEEQELAKAVDQLREMVGQVHGRKTLL